MFRLKVPMVLSLLITPALLDAPRERYSWKNT
jgi:hypothetical protein